MLNVVHSKAQNTEDGNDMASYQYDSVKVRIALITCDPGPDAYQMFGHSAIRVTVIDNPQYDIVYNYGVFDSRRDNFIYAFVKGETDYVLAAEPAEWFFSKYNDGFGINVYEQVLNLDHDQKWKLVKMLENNALPQNRTYRYNFLYDNCTTRARDIIEKAVEQEGGEIVYQGNVNQNTDTSFRDLIHVYTNNAPWLQFGIDFLLGQEVDKKRSDRELMFLPLRLKKHIATANRFQKMDIKGLVVQQEITKEATTDMNTTPDFPLSPLVTFSIVLMITIALCLFDIKRGKLSLWADIAGLFVRGLAGFIIAFLFFFSKHPAVGSNWLILAFNPLAFFIIPDIVFSNWQQRFMKAVKIRGKKYDIFELVNLAVLVFTLVLFVLPLQRLNIAMLPLVLTLLIRSLTRIKLMGYNKQ